jgi:WD40 repeat protein
MTKPLPASLPVKLVRTLEGHTASVTVAKFNRMKNYFVIQHPKFFLPWEEQTRFLIHLKFLKLISISSFYKGKGEHCVSGGYDRTLRLWNPFNGKLIKTYRGHGYQVTDLDMYCYMNCFIQMNICFQFSSMSVSPTLSNTHTIYVQILRQFSNRFLWWWSTAFPVGCHYRTSNTQI